MKDLTELTALHMQGDTAAGKDLELALFGELRQLAGKQMARERAGHTLQPTALVNEAYLRLVNVDRLSIRDRTHFKALVGRAMRNVLIDHARRYNADKRADERLRVSNLDGVMDPSADAAFDLLELYDALDRLKQHNARHAEVVELRFMGGLTAEETASELGVSVQTVYRDWDFARAWLRRDLSEGAHRG